MSELLGWSTREGQLSVCEYREVCERGILPKTVERKAPQAGGAEFCSPFSELGFSPLPSALPAIQA